MKLTNNTAKLLKILIIMVGLFCTIVVFGLITRTKPKAVEQIGVETIVDQSSRSIAEWVYRTSTNVRVRYLQACIKALRAEVQELRKEAEISSLTPMQKYVNYAWEISEKWYPDIHPAYVCAIIYHESRFDPNATNSKTGVKGLCQINPRWHSKRAANLGVTDLYDPWGNILVCYDILNELAQSKGFTYALNFYAGGYHYADQYLNRMSPFERELGQIMDEQNFAQYVLPYSIH